MKNILKLILLVLFVTQALTAYTQVRVGVRSGVFFAKFRYFSDDELIWKTQTVTGLDAGVTLDVNLSRNILYNAELNFVQKGGEHVSKISPFKAVLNQVEIVQGIGFEPRFGNFCLLVNAAAFYGHFINGKTTSRTGTMALKFDNRYLKRPDIGYSLGIGVGYKIGKGDFFLESRFRQSILYTTDNDVDVNSVATKNIGIGICSGFKLNL